MASGLPASISRLAPATSTIISANWVSELWWSRVLYQTSIATLNRNRRSRMLEPCSHMVSRRLSWSVPVMCVVKRGMNPSSTVMPTLSTLTRNAFATNDITSTASTFTVSSMKMMRANSEKCACSVPRSEDSRCQLFTASTIATSNSTGTA